MSTTAPYALLQMGHWCFVLTRGASPVHRHEAMAYLISSGYTAMDASDLLDLLCAEHAQRSKR